MKGKCELIGMYTIIGRSCIGSSKVQIDVNKLFICYVYMRSAKVQSDMNILFLGYKSTQASTRE